MLRKNGKFVVHHCSQGNCSLLLQVIGTGDKVKEGFQYYGAQV